MIPGGRLRLLSWVPGPLTLFGFLQVAEKRAPGELRGCSAVAEQLPNKCRTVAPKAEFFEQHWPMLANTWSTLRRIRPPLVAVCPTWVDFGQHLTNFDQHSKIWAVLLAELGLVLPDLVNAD